MTVRCVLLLMIAATIAMIVARVLLYPPLLQPPAGISVAARPALLLAVYAVIVVWLTSLNGASVRIALVTGTALGAVSGLVSVLHIAQENFVTLTARATAIITWLFIVSMFLPWAIAGYRVARQTGRVATGSLAGAWAAMVCMVITVAFGFGQLLCCLERLVQRDSTSPDFIRSGWTDLRAFAIGDIFDAGFWHLLLGPALGAIFGTLATTFAKLRR